MTEVLNLIPAYFLFLLGVTVFFIIFSFFAMQQPHVLTWKRVDKVLFLSGMLIAPMAPVYLLLFRSVEIIWITGGSMATFLFVHQLLALRFGRMELAIRLNKRL